MKYKELLRQFDQPYFTRDQLEKRNLDFFDNQLTQWQKDGSIKQVKKGFYVFSNQQDKLSSEEVSFLLYRPSYISLEYALRKYNFIPEMVETVTAVSTKKTRKFSNIYGDFSYRQVKSDLFFGYEPKKTKYSKYLLATPEKAILDFFYLNSSRLDNQEDISELRFNYNEIEEQIERSKLQKYADFFNKKTNKLVNILLEQCSL